MYENATRINGKTRKKNIVRVKIGKKTYKAKANKKGKFTVKIPRVAAGKKYTLKSYKGKKLYKTKKVYVIAKKLRSINIRQTVNLFLVTPDLLIRLK